ncbi:MAG: DNA polymerase IV [Planctomycetaceae bacterium]|jgi:DNA polymerase IV|nr:DNA polymerase IV [Planctomycetaceae bacterium]MBT6153679.1 DNA polymerase IV [Planctomycetaceae bacterium]MBT6483709.1 DNA polymerase IV [Planctomycetaceae bacterium]MBT6497187.1 DNA polymerase IV [Planctomycetaceae bacterium]
MILHVDMDAFYASVEERDRPELAGKPLIVGGSPEGRGVVAAANYAVRKFGVHSAMPTATALKRCPHAIVVRPRMDRYADVSAAIRDLFIKYTPLVEPLSLDEAFLDVTGSEGLFGSAVEIAHKLKREIRESLKLVASVGVAPNKFLAKIASDLDKPDGLVVVDPDRVQEFLAPLPVRRLWGVGRVTGRVLEQLGVGTIGQLRQMPLDELRQRFGKSGEHLWELAHGIDDRAVIPDHEAKSISHETTFPADIEDPEVLRACLLGLTEQVARRLRQQSLRGRVVQIKLRFADFRTITRSKKLPQPTDSTELLWQTASKLLATSLTDTHVSFRLLGMGVSDIEHVRLSQGTLFDDPQDHSQLDAVSDTIRDRFGTDAIQRGSSLGGGAGSKKETR